MNIYYMNIYYMNIYYMNTIWTYTNLYYIYSLSLYIYVYTIVILYPYIYIYVPGSQFGSFPLPNGIIPRAFPKKPAFACYLQHCSISESRPPICMLFAPPTPQGEGATTYTSRYLILMIDMYMYHVCVDMYMYVLYTCYL